MEKWDPKPTDVETCVDDRMLPLLRTSQIGQALSPRPDGSSGGSLHGQGKIWGSAGKDSDLRSTGRPCGRVGGHAHSMCRG